jgi:hypothetical protein
MLFVMKMSKTKEHKKLLYVSTEHATTRSTDGSTWVVNIGNTLYADKVDAISPLKVTIANLFPNVTLHNNLFSVSNTDGTVNVTVPVGNYTAAEYATAVTALLTAVNVTLEIGAGNPYFVWTSNNVHGDTTIFSTSIDWWNLVGYGSTDAVVFAQTTAVPAPHLPNMGGEKIVHISCDKISHGNLVHAQDGKLHDIVLSVPLSDTAYGFNTSFVPQADDTYIVDYRYTCSLASSLEFQLLDSKMRPLPYPLSHHIQMIFRLYHHENRGGA